MWHKLFCNNQLRHEQEGSPMTTECHQLAFDFHSLGGRRVTAAFDGGTITSDGGALLLRELEVQTGLLASLAQCFNDHRDPELVEHPVEELVKQRVLARRADQLFNRERKVWEASPTPISLQHRAWFKWRRRIGVGDLSHESTQLQSVIGPVLALALGYEALNDHDPLRTDPLLATLVGKQDPLGQARVAPRDRGQALAGKSTLNRLELTPAGARATSRYQKIVARHGDLESWFVEAFLQLTPPAPAEIVLDLDATDDPLPGHPLGRFFHGY